MASSEPTPRPAEPLSSLAPPLISAALPGPRAASTIALDRACLSPSYTRPYPLVVAHGAGCWIEDADGNRFLDFTAGIAVCTTGHCHPRIVEAIRRQAGQLLHMCLADFYHPLGAQLAEKLAALSPGNFAKRVLFTNSGTESIEAAIKLARHHTGRPYLIAFYGGFHGRSLGALSLTASKAVQRRGYQPLMPGVVHLPFPNPLGARAADAPPPGFDAIDWLERHVFTSLAPPDEVAAVVVEPIQGEGGYLIPPADFHRRLQEATRRHGILYIADEIQTGLGRTGRMFASEHFGVEPDIVCLAKGLASGLPLGAIVARADLMDWPPGAHASTFGGNPVSCAAAWETLQMLEEGLVQHAAERGAQLMERLRDLTARHPEIGHARGLGLMAAVDCLPDAAGKRSAIERRNRLLDAAFRRGLLLLGCGETAVRFCPPLVVEPEEIDLGVQLLEAALHDIAATP